MEYGLVSLFVVMDCFSSDADMGCSRGLVKVKARFGGLSVVKIVLFRMGYDTSGLSVGLNMQSRGMIHLGWRIVWTVVRFA